MANAFKNLLNEYICVVNKLSRLEENYCMSAIRYARTASLGNNEELGRLNARVCNYSRQWNMYHSNKLMLKAKLGVYGVEFYKDTAAAVAGTSIPANKIPYVKGLKQLSDGSYVYIRNI